MVRISHNITFWPFIVTLRFTMATAWFVKVVQPPSLHQYRLMIRSNSFMKTIQQQQQQHHHTESSVAVLMLSLKTDDTTTTSTTVLESTAKSTSETSIKIRALASFISMNMLESMLAAGIPIEKILSMTSLSSSDSSSSSPPDDDATSTTTPFVDSGRDVNGGGGAVTDDTLVSVENSESSTLLHQKEGDRIIAMQDTFNTDDSIPSSIQLPKTDTSSELFQEFVDSKNSEDPIGASSTMPSSSLHQQQQQQLLLIPEIPSVISKAFGRPLPVIQEHVPSMQPTLLASPITSPSMTTVSPRTISTTNTTNEMNDISQSNEAVSTYTGDNTGTTIRTDMKVVTDEDPYGE